MIVWGLDASADHSRFGYCACRESESRLELLDHGCLRSHSHLAELVAARLAQGERCLLGIDAPLGWPSAMATALPVHRAGMPIGVRSDDLFTRYTDRAIRDRLGKRPLEIGAALIARTAVSALEALQAIRTATGESVPLLWDWNDANRIAAIEVYPAATLTAWGASLTGYKDRKSGSAARRAIADRLISVAPWLPTLVEQPVDVFDAAVCAVAALDFLRGDAIGPKDIELAQKEGWIWARASGIR